jgi:hypothetical protein
VTHTSDDQESPAVLISSRLEEANPNIDFSHSYKMARLFGLSPDQKTFLFKLIQNILPTRERLHRTGKATSPSCSFCDTPEDSPDHLLTCPYSTQVATPLLASLSSQAGNLSAKDVILLNFHTPESWELPAVWLIATCLNCIWEDRLAKNVSGKD